MNFHFTPKAASAAAKRLRGHLARNGINLQHAKAVEAVARVLNFENASAMRAGLETDTPPQTQPQERIDHDTVECFLTAMETVIAEANHALEERESGVEDGLYDADDNPTGQISADISKVEAALPRIRAFLRTMTAPARPIFDHDALAVAIRHAEHPAARGRLTFHRDTDGALHVDIIEVDWDSDRAETLQAMLAYLARPDSVLPGLLLDVVEETPGVYRLATAIDHDAARDPDTVAAELGAALSRLCLCVGVEDGETFFLTDIHENFARQERMLLRLYRSALAGDPTARRVFGWLMHTSPAYAERLVTELRQQLGDAQRREKPDGGPEAAATREVWDWLETGRLAREDGPHPRMLQIQLVPGTTRGPGWQLEVPDVSDESPRPLYHLSDLTWIRRVLRTGASMETPLGFDLDTVSEFPDGGLTITYSFARDH